MKPKKYFRLANSEDGRYGHIKMSFSNEKWQSDSYMSITWQYNMDERRPYATKLEIDSKSPSDIKSFIRLFPNYIHFRFSIKEAIELAESKGYGLAGYCDRYETGFSDVCLFDQTVKNDSGRLESSHTRIFWKGEYYYGGCSHNPDMIVKAFKRSYPEATDYTVKIAKVTHSELERSESIIDEFTNVETLAE